MKPSRAYPEDKEPFSVLKNSVFEKQSVFLKVESREGSIEVPEGPLRTHTLTFHVTEDRTQEDKGELATTPSSDPYLHQNQ